MITVKEICKKFGDKEILGEVSLTVSAGEVVGLVGLNGVGKTTLLRLILGILNVDSGHSEILGEIPTPKNSKILRKTGIILDNDGFNGNFTFVENMQFFAKIKGVESADLQEYIDKNWSQMQQKNNRPVKLFSKGERMQCAIARAFLGDPKAIILDEPTTGLDYEQCDKFFEMVKNAQANGAATIISSHNFFALDKLCTKVIELKNAKLKDISDGFFNNI
ncbi:MAG: ABC transporter ATP-binding protein [Chitinivibrionia bacterium]|nr:ABC transporter ATP-binding protein [Chitinivibrionia bacterium]